MVHLNRFQNEPRISPFNVRDIEAGGSRNASAFTKCSRREVARGLAKADDPLCDRVRQFIIEARSGTSLAVAARQANVSLALIPG